MELNGYLEAKPRMLHCNGIMQHKIDDASIKHAEIKLK